MTVYNHLLMYKEPFRLPDHLPHLRPCSRWSLAAPRSQGLFFRGSFELFVQRSGGLERAKSQRRERLASAVLSDDTYTLDVAVEGRGLFVVGTRGFSMALLPYLVRYLEVSGAVLG